jgi:prepilin-type N-terminal cleavage/methylation domain-containing protein
MKIKYIRVNTILNAFKSQTGTTLIEVLVAIAILGVGGATYAYALSAGSVAVNNQETLAAAQNLARTQFEVIENTAYDSSGSSYSTISTPSNYSVSFKADTGVYGDANIQKITVSVYHNAGQIYVLQGYKVNR